MHDGAASSDHPVLEVSGLSVAYQSGRGAPVPAVIDVSLRIEAGQSVGLVGESGCGKTSVAFAIMQYLGRRGRITHGDVRLRGESLREATPVRLRALRGSVVAMVYQDPTAALNPSMRIGDQLVEVATTHNGLTRQAALARAYDLLAAMRLRDPKRIACAFPHELSGGQQQRVVVAMALISVPALLILDEPTTALDVTVQASVMALVREVAGGGNTALLHISHNLGLIRETCDAVNVMYAGQIVESGPVDAVFARSAHPYTRGLLGATPTPSSDDRCAQPLPIDGQVPPAHDRPRGCAFGPRCNAFVTATCGAANITLHDCGRADTHRVRCARWQEIGPYVPPPIVAQHAPVPRLLPQAADAAPAVRVTHLSKHFRVAGGWGGAGLFAAARGRTVRANDGVSLTAQRGKTLAIVGESGCGKSTLARILAGLQSSTSGAAHVLGWRVDRLPIRRRDDAQIRALQMVFQNPTNTLNPAYSVGRQLARSVRKLGDVRGRKAVRRRIFELLQLVNLPFEIAARRPIELSGGQRQRVGIARAIAGAPAVLIADEPVSALDVSVQAAICELLLSIQRQRGTTLVFISHDLGLVRHIADHVAVMYLGRVVESGTTREIFAPPYHPYTEALLAAVPLVDSRLEKRAVLLECDPGNAVGPTTGCPFASRCPQRIDERCEHEPPPQRILTASHAIWCHLDAAVLAAAKPVFGWREDRVQSI